MNTSEQQHFNLLYQQHLTNLTLQGMRPATIDAYSRAVRRITQFFDQSPDTLTKVSLRLHSLTWAVSPIQSFLESKSAVTHYFLDNSMAGNFLGWL
ncbi:phage integrase N-terminal SAM-like domain-containing protein, partial [Psychromonas antarctica]|uniref:phage integrase N-terminal SAM-like domain-containing protein n=1 Tax=Psychromonas antarctica TaxID=67573 RepID=UPI001EE7CD5A